MTSPLHQRGSMALTMGLLLLGLVSILGLVEVGYLYWAKRDAQKVADLAALSGAQRLETCADNNGDNLAARHNAAEDNGFGGDLEIQCVYWAADVTEHGDKHYTSPDNEHPRNAVRVKASLPLAPFFGFANISGVSAEAIAANRGDPIASFSVGSRLLGLGTDDSVLEPLLGSALGTSLGLKLLSYEGIANSNISLLGLKNLLHLDAGTVDGVLDTEITAGAMLNGIIQLLKIHSEEAANIDLSTISTKISETDIKLADILNINAGTTDPNVALDAQVNAESLINATLQAANKGHALEADLDELNILGIAHATLKLSVIEPPVIGIGKAGYNNDGSPRTISHTAQIRLKLELTLADSEENKIFGLITGGSDKSLSKIPINVELVPAEGWIDSIQCHIPDSYGVRNIDFINIKTTPGILTLFIGNLPESTFTDTKKIWKDVVQDQIDNGYAYADLVNLKVLFAKVKLLAYVGAWAVNPEPIDNIYQILNKKDQLPLTIESNTTSNLLASALSDALSKKGFRDTELKTENLGPLGLVLNQILSIIDPLVNGLLTTLGEILNPILSELDKALIKPLLVDTLGLSVGSADTTLTDVNCNTGVQLVY